MTKTMKPTELLQPPPALLALLKERASFVIATHRGPDGDALGGSLALLHALLGQGKEVQLVSPTVAGDHYHWMPGIEHLTQAITGTPEVAVFVDCDGIGRVDALAEALNALPTVADIDHHSGQPFGQVQYVDPTAAAASLLVLRVLEALEWPVTPAIAACLYTGIATDTGFFRFQNTSEEALGACSRLVAAGADPFTIADLVHDSRPVPRMQLAGRALAGLQTACDGRIVYSVLKPADYAATGTRPADTENVIDLFKSAEGQEVCVLLKASRSETNWQASLRAAEVDVSMIARHFGGGGHARAAGFDYEGQLETLLAELLGLLGEALASGEKAP
jgi:bifunctional oligoribonuclease and PAP phosphatase NrnA